MASVARPPRGSATLASRAAPGPIDDVPLLPVANPYLLAIGIMIASLIQILDTTIANVAIPHMQASLGATPDEISWVLTSYIVATAVAMPITGWLADRIGSRRLFLFSVSGFVIASMMCGLAQNITEMVIFRALQGVTGAFIGPLSQAGMIDTNKPSKQGQMMAIWGMGIMVGPILGPILGGWLTENWNWRACFYVNVPLGALSLFILFAELPSRKLLRRKFDLFGFAMVAIALTSIQMLLDRGNRIDWFHSLEAWIYAGAALSSGWVGIIHLTTARTPLFDRRMFADRNFIVAFAFMFAMGVIMFSTMALLPPMLQRMFGYTVIGTGMMLMPRGIGTLITMQISGVLVRRGVDPRLFIVSGFTIAAFSLWQMSGWSLAVDQHHIVVASFIQGLGMGMTFIPLNTLAFATLGPALRTDGASLINLSRSMGSSIGISIVTTLLAYNVQAEHSELAGHVTASMTALIDFSSVDRLQSFGTAVLSMIDREVNRQAAMVAYIDDFRLVMWMSIGVLPLVLFMRKPGLPPPVRP